MARTVPGSGAVIEPIFDEFFGVRAVLVKDGGSGYVQTDPPRLTVEGCGTPDEEALLYPIIDESSGRIVHVRVLTRGRGYDPLRLQIVLEQETPTVVNHLILIEFGKVIQILLLQERLLQTQIDFVLYLIITLNLHQSLLKEHHGGPLVDRSFDQTFIYRGGKDVPNPGIRVDQKDKVTGILANGGSLTYSRMGC